VSDPASLIRTALVAGVELRYMDGKLKVTGNRAAVDAWVPRLREHRQELIEALKPATDWRPLATAYNRHHFACPTCIASGKGYGLRCGVGASLWIAYSEAG